ncbi:MAG: P27 family phage terminase small subunit [Propionibacteriaceae bacterium]|nr:P27 family phage terminase small subunit [Propionibacteriaceae bacterium]
MTTLAGVIAELSAGRELSPFDEEAVRAFAGQVLRLREAQGRLESEGMIVGDSKGLPVEHPALGIERAASAEMRQWVARRPDLFGRPVESGAAKGGGIGDQLAAARAAREARASG